LPYGDNIKDVINFLGISLPKKLSFVRDAVVIAVLFCEKSCLMRIFVRDVVVIAIEFAIAFAIVIFLFYYILCSLRWKTDR
jgi:hypothetical protein